LLADFETGTDILNPVDGRSGSWFSFNDGSGKQTPEKASGVDMPASQPGACGTAFALHSSGTDFAGWGAGVGVDLVEKESGIKQPYALSSYSGFAFLARASETLLIRVSWSDGNTAEEGGVCDSSAQSGDLVRCGDYFRKDIILSTEWARYEVQFAEMTQRGIGLSIPEGFSPETAYTFRAQTPSSDFEFWLDELILLP